MIDQRLIFAPDSQVASRIWAIAYMRALHFEEPERASETADRALQLWRRHCIGGDFSQPNNEELPSPT